MKLRQKLKLLFWILIGLAFVKLIFLAIFIGGQIPLLHAREQISKYNCPPEFSEYLVIEKERLKEEEKKLEAKKKELELLEKKIKEQIAVLKDLEATIDEKLRKVEVIYNRRFANLVKTISEMRPKKAADLLLNMDPTLASKILSQLRSSQAANILSAMPPEKAALLSESLSGIPPKKY